jgi:hypothetical protein
MGLVISGGKGPEEMSLLIRKAHLRGEAPHEVLIDGHTITLLSSPVYPRTSMEVDVNEQRPELVSERRAWQQ